MCLDESQLSAPSSHLDLKLLTSPYPLLPLHRWSADELTRLCCVKSAPYAFRCQKAQLAPGFGAPPPGPQLS